MDLAIIAYFAVATVAWGAFITIVKDMPVTNLVMAVLWPLSCLLVAGVVLGASLKGGGR